MMIHDSGLLFRAILYIQVGPKSKQLPNDQKNRIKSYQHLWMRSDLFVKLKYQSSTI